MVEKNSTQLSVTPNVDPRYLVGRLFESGVKQIEKGQSKQIEEAQSQGVPPEQLLGQLLNQVKERQQLINQAETQANFISEQSRGPMSNFNIEPASSPFSQAKIEMDESGGLRFKQGGFFNLRSTSGDIETLKALQTITGQQPISIAKLQELDITSRNEINKENRQEQKEIRKSGREQADEYVNRVTSPEGLKALGADISLAQNSSRNVDELLTLADFNPETGELGNPNFTRSFNPKSQFGQTVTDLINTITNDMLRIQSGASITEDDRKFFELIQAKPRSFFTNPKTNLNRLLEIKSRLDGFVDTAAPDINDQPIVSELKKNGISNESIFQLKQEGAF